LRRRDKVGVRGRERFEKKATSGEGGGRRGNGSMARNDRWHGGRGVVQLELKLDSKDPLWEEGCGIAESCWGGMEAGVSWFLQIKIPERSNR